MDIRVASAKYYDLSPTFPEDIPFYLRMLPSADASVLELGCGTGRATLPLASACRFVHGLDNSASMLDACRQKLASAHLSAERVQVEQADITNFALARKFDLIIAPFRVLQNLETDQQVDGLFGCIRHHLAPGGTCILNVFRPSIGRANLHNWVRATLRKQWEVLLDGDRVVGLDRRPRSDIANAILYPELVWRRYSGDVLVDESTLRIVMRCYYPDAFARLITRHGFRILHRWGGYAGEKYGSGPELVIAFG